VSLLKALFNSFEQCSGELSLPVHLQGVKSKGQAEVAVTLYQHVCVHLCSFIASFDPSLFPELDAALLNAVLSADMITSLLAMDAWCFLARYGTAELCAHHVTIVAHVFFFMAPPHQVEFIQKFSPKEAENLPLWQCISFQALPAELRKQTAHEITKVCTAECRKWLSSSRTLGELESLNTVLSVLLAVCNSAGEALDAGQQTEIMEVGRQLWAFLNIKQVTGQPYVQQTFSLLLPLLGFFIQTLDPQLVSQTGFVDETEAAKVERVKQEKGIFWQHFAKVTVEEAKRSSFQ
uniref:Uncharacterized protein n=1 Tax=Propithecus coquereli TaxID=379532 RepID=A0A2K6FXW1_PROCO